MLVKYATLWLFTLSLSPCNLYVYLLIIFGLFTLALAGDMAFYFYRVHNVVFNACMYACSMHVCKVYICVHTTPRHIPHFVGDGEIN